MKKLLSALLLLTLLVTAFAACSDSNENGSAGTAPPGDTTVASESDTEGAVLELPEGLTFPGGEFTIAAWNGGNVSDGWCNYLDCDEPEAGNILQEAVLPQRRDLRTSRC